MDGRVLGSNPGGREGAREGCGRATSLRWNGHWAPAVWGCGIGGTEAEAAPSERTDICQLPSNEENIFFFLSEFEIVLHIEKHALQKQSELVNHFMLMSIDNHCEPDLERNILFLGKWRKFAFSQVFNKGWSYEKHANCPLSKTTEP